MSFFFLPSLFHFLMCLHISCLQNCILILKSGYLWIYQCVAISCFQFINIVNKRINV